MRALLDELIENDAELAHLPVPRGSS